MLELSGITVDDDKATFTELGFDSLFLTQASQAIQSRFGVKVTFRQMLGDLSSVASLAKHLDAEMPADRHAGRARSRRQPASASLATGGNPLEQLLANNLQIMQAMLAGQAPAAPAAPANGLSHRSPGPPT